LTHFLLVANRYDMAPGDLRTNDPRDYPFTVITLETDAKEGGSGTHMQAAKLHFNKKHLLEVQDYLPPVSTIVPLKHETHY
jgi:hypothetical protein